VVDGDGNQIGVVTGADGKYEFPGLPPGDYIVKFTPPSGYAISPKDQGGDDTTDSDADIITGETDVITLTAGQTDVDVDAGFYSTSGKVAIGNYVWRDSNGNSAFDSGESPVANTNVWLYQDSNGDGVCDPANDTQVAATTTDANGHYYFLGVTPSTSGDATTNYCVVVDRVQLRDSYGYVYSSAGGAHDPDSSDETDASGDDGVPSGDYVVSQVFAATENGQGNTGDAGDPVGYSDASAYMTVDFGFIHQDDPQPPNAVNLTGISASGGTRAWGLGLTFMGVLGMAAFLWRRRR
jgi:hypothetical protein